MKLQNLLTLAATTALITSSQLKAAATLNITMTSANGGAQTTVTYAFGGDWVSETGYKYESAYYGESLSGVAGIQAHVGSEVSTATSPISAYTTPTPSGSQNFSSGIPLITLTNLNNSSQVNIAGFFLNAGSNVMGFATSFPLGTSPLPVNGNQYVRVSGATSGAFTIDKAFDYFNQGTWSPTPIQAPNSQYTTVVIAGVPEPSAMALTILASGMMLIRRKR